MAQSHLKRLTINMTPSTYDELHQDAQRLGISVTEYLRRARELKRVLDAEGVKRVPSPSGDHLVLVGLVDDAR